MSECRFGDFKAELMTVLWMWERWRDGGVKDVEGDQPGAVSLAIKARI
jgi:hypothetical protein